MPKIVVILPCYNEEAVLPITHRQCLSMLEKLKQQKKISLDSYLFYVDDGSIDNSWNLIEEFNKSNPESVKAIRLSSNEGHQKALLAGLFTAMNSADLFITMDADMQDDIQVLPEMIFRFNEGNDIVYGVRSSRKTDSWYKKNTALLYYKLITWLGVRCVYNHADYRLMSARAVKQLSYYRERNLFLRGIVPLMGYQTTSVYYSRHERKAGESHYPFSKMLNFAIDGITSFTIRPLRLITGSGVLFLLLSFIAMIYTLVRWFNGQTVEGWASLMISLWFLGGLLLVSLGIVGEYIGKIYIEVKDRPRYNIEKSI